MPKEKLQQDLFNSDDFHNHSSEWKDMPEFIQEDLQPYKSVIVHFENKADLDSFSKLIEQKITYKTKSIWFPKADIADNVSKRYIDGPE